MISSFSYDNEIEEVETENCFVFLWGLLAHYRPAMPFGNRKEIFQGIFSVQFCHNFIYITPLQT